jgi:putative heme iron utilization protein
MAFQWTGALAQPGARFLRQSFSGCWLQSRLRDRAACAPGRRRGTGVEANVRHCFRVRRENGLRRPAALVGCSTSSEELHTRNVERAWHENRHQLSTGERARTVLHVCATGTLCTASFKHGGHPFGTHVDFILDEWGRPIFLLAKNAAHSINLRHDPRCSLFAQPRDSSGQGGQRATLVGELYELEGSELEEYAYRYIERFPHAEQALSYPEFRFYRMEVQDVYYVGGFGVTATWVDVEEYRNAKPDPLALDAPTLLVRLNREHKEELLRFCRVFLDIEPLDCSIVSLDRLGFDLRVRLCPCEEDAEPSRPDRAANGAQQRNVSSSSNGRASEPRDKRVSGSESSADPDCNEYREYRVAFREPVGNTFDVRSELVKTMQEAWEIENGLEDLWIRPFGRRPTVLYYDQESRKVRSIQQEREEAEIVRRRELQVNADL